MKYSLHSQLWSATCLYHADVIGAVANCESDGLRLVTNQVDKFGFLQWWRAAADDCLAGCSNAQEVSTAFERQRKVQRLQQSTTHLVKGRFHQRQLTLTVGFLRTLTSS